MKFEEAISQFPEKKKEEPSAKKPQLVITGRDLIESGIEPENEEMKFGELIQLINQISAEHNTSRQKLLKKVHTLKDLDLDAIINILKKEHNI